MKHIIMMLLLLFSPIALMGKDADDKAKDESKDKNTSSTQDGNAEAEKTVKIGNLSFPVSQQPTPLVSFGQNVLDKSQAQVIINANQFRGEKGYLISVIPQLVYGLTDDLSLTIVVPEAVRFRQEDHHSSGLGDTFFQLEYAYYTKAHRTYYDQATILGYVSIPTGSTRKNPMTGTGSNSYFIGATFSRMEINWFYFTSFGANFNGSSHRTKFGDLAFYQLGVGRRIANSKEWLFDWQLELTGIYSQKDRIYGKTQTNSGGNIIFLTPSLFLSSSENFILQIGVGFPIQQNLFGHQPKNKYFLDMNATWTF